MYIYTIGCWGSKWRMHIPPWLLTWKYFGHTWNSKRMYIYVFGCWSADRVGGGRVHQGCIYMSLAVGKNLLGTQRVINQWGEQQKGWTKFLKFSGGKQRGGGGLGNINFWLKFCAGKNLGGNYEVTPFSKSNSQIAVIRFGEHVNFF